MSSRFGKFSEIALLAILAVGLIGLPLAGQGGQESLEGLTNFDDLQVDSLILPGGLYPIGYATDGEQMVAVSQDVTGSETVTHGLTTVTWAMCNLAEDPAATAGAGAHCTVEVAANVVTAKVWQDDFVTAATEADVAVNILVIGTP